MRRRGRLVVLMTLATAAALFAAWWYFPSATRLHLEGGASEIFEKAEAWELLSLSARHPPAMRQRIDAVESGGPMPTGLFRWKSVLGRVTVDDPGIRRKLTRSFNRGRRGWNHRSVFCWAPRHALCASLEGGERVELLICFQCSKFRAYSGAGERIAQGHMAESQREALDRTFQSLGLEIEPRGCGGD